MKQYNRKNLICYLICISLVFSWVTFGISNTSELFSSSSKDDSYTFQVIKDALPATVSTRSESGMQTIPIQDLAVFLQFF